VLTTRRRRALQQRADRLLDQLAGCVVRIPVDATPKSTVILLTERTRPILMRRGRIHDELHAVGLRIEGLGEVLQEIEQSTQDDGQRMPAIILLDGWAQVAFVESFILSPGGNA
jgi:hypothetical protein